MICGVERMHLFEKDLLETESVGDAALVERARGGDQTAAGLLVERYWRYGVALAMATTREHDAAEDVAQESFVQAFRQLHSLRRPEAFVGWLGCIVRRRCADHVRQARRRRTVSIEQIPFTVLTDASAPRAEEVSDTQLEQVRHAVAELPVRYREIVLLRFMDGLNYNEIARRLGQRPGTVRVRLHRALGRLRHQLDGLLAED